VGPLWPNKACHPATKRHEGWLPRPRAFIRLGSLFIVPSGPYQYCRRVAVPTNRDPGKSGAVGQSGGSNCCPRRRLCQIGGKLGARRFCICHTAALPDTADAGASGFTGIAARARGGIGHPPPTKPRLISLMARRLVAVVSFLKPSVTGCRSNTRQACTRASHRIQSTRRDTRFAQEADSPSS